MNKRMIRSNNCRHTLASILRSASLCLLLMPLCGQAQNPAPLAHPDLHLGVSGNVNAAVVLPGGGIVFGGDFTEVDGTAHMNIAKLDANGALDPSWNPSVDGTVYALAVDPSGNIFVGGQFATVGGKARKNLAKLSGGGSGTTDPNWDPSADYAGSKDAGVGALATDASGNVYVGGYFSTIGGQARSRIAKLAGSGSGVADPNWDASADGGVWALATDASGNVYAGGGFFNIGGQVRHRIAKLAGSGTGAADPDWDPSAYGDVLALATDLSGNVYAGGRFRSIGGQTRNYIAKLSGSGSGNADPNWNPSANSEVDVLATTVSGNVYAGGLFSTMGGQVRKHIAKLAGSGNGGADPDWNPSADSWVYALATGASDNVYAGGYFSNIGGQVRSGLAVLSDADGAVVGGANLTLPGTVHSVAMQTSGGIIVGGAFDWANGLIRHNILRLEADGTLDPDWNPSADDWVFAVATDTHDNVYAGGEFYAIGGQARKYIAKLAGTGSGAADPDWNPSANRAVNALATDPSGNIYAGGRFEKIGGQTRSYIAKLSSSGSGAADPDWNPSADSVVNALATDLGGDVYVGGYFSNIGGQARSYIAKLTGSGSGSAALGWNPSADDSVWALATDPSGDIYVGGRFSNIGGLARSNIAKLAGSGSADPAWDPSADDDVLALAADSSGNVYAGGLFENIGGQTRSYIAKLPGTGSGGADPDWNPSADDRVLSLAIDPSGDVYVGGWFTTIGGQQRVGLAALPATAPINLIFRNGFEL